MTMTDSLTLSGSPTYLDLGLSAWKGILCSPIWASFCSNSFVI